MGEWLTDLTQKKIIIGNVQTKNGARKPNGKGIDLEKRMLYISKAVLPPA